MSFGLGRLRWTPDAFWSATPREIAAALRAHQAAPANAPIDRQALEQLIATHPDG